MKRIYENGETSTAVEFFPVGYGINGQLVYAKRITVYTIADGIIKNGEYVAPAKWYR